MAHIFTNDTLAEYRDRWKTGGYAVSLFRGTSWTGTLPARFGEIIELRFRGDAIAPRDVVNPAPNDRLYAGTWWIGAHTHYQWSGVEISAGLDLAVTGPQTGIIDIHAGIHDLLELPAIDLGQPQIDNGVYLHATAEIARRFDLPMGEFRPFVEVQAGVETLARVGFDVTFGDLSQGALMTRDPVTGQRIAGILPEGGGGWSAVFGADIAHVEQSIFLPDDRGPALLQERRRVRGGIAYRNENLTVFYGMTHLSPEFVGQGESQLVGNLALTIAF